MHHIKSISAEDTRPLRHQILRPMQTLAECVYPGDEESDSFHVGAFQADELVCVASFFAQSSDKVTRKNQFRLRGMATVEQERGKGIGAAVLAMGEAIARKQGSEAVWCNARTTAAPYYLKQDYTAFEEVFEIEGIGPHVVMWKPLT